jgi:hypothetical protein
MRRLPLLTAGLVLGALAAPAAALPGDPPITLLSPAPDVTLAADPAGIGVTYACPVYRQTDLGGGFVVFGKWSDYGVAVATSPDVGTDGRLRQDRIVASDTGHQPNTLPADQCAGTLGTGRADGPENAPGTYWWQAYRVTSAGYDVSEVRSFAIRSAAAPRVLSPGPAFGGYPVTVPLRLAGGGRTIKGFRATVTMLCPEVGLPGGQGQLTTRAGFAPFRSARITPDGRFIAAATRSGSAVLVRGKVRGRTLTGGVAQLSVGTCTGSGTFTAARR